MQAAQLLRLLHNPHNITSEDVSDLKAMLRVYPYFQAVHFLLAKVAYDEDPSSAGPAVQTAAVYATDRQHFKAFLENTPPFSTSDAAATPAIPVAAAKAPPQVDLHDCLHGYINTIQQKSQRKITKQKNLAQLDCIQAFLQKDEVFKPPSASSQATPPETPQVDLTQQSTTFHDDLATENLAQVLWQQGKHQRALVIYEKIMLKFPEKKPYFEDCIAALKREI